MQQQLTSSKSVSFFRHLITLTAEEQLQIQTHLQQDKQQESSHISLQAFCLQSLKSTSLLGIALLGMTYIATGDELTITGFFFSSASLTYGWFRGAIFYFGFWVLFWLIN